MVKWIILSFLGLCLWLGASAFGFFQLMTYENTSAMASYSSDWPSKSKFITAPNQATLLMFLHPECPCSRASLKELASLLKSTPKIKVYLIFYQPHTFPAAWHKESSLWELAHQLMPFANFYTDWDGTEAAQFKSGISGQTLLFDERHKLLFNGGITSARGQEGENSSKTALARLLDKQSSTQINSKVFGCPILRSRMGVQRG